MLNSILVLLALLTLVSCKDTPTDPDSDDTTVRWIMPTAGSQYRMAIVTTDSGRTVDTQHEDDILRIISTIIPWLGRDSTYLYGWSNTSRQYHVTFEPNGDTGYETGSGGIYIFPTGTVGRVTIPMETDSTGSMHTVTNAYKENLGREKIVLAGVEYNAIKIVEQRVEVQTPAGSSEISSTTTTVQVWWFVPTLGFNAKTVKDVTTEMSSGERTHYSRSQTLTQIIN